MIVVIATNDKHVTLSKPSHLLFFILPIMRGGRVLVLILQRGTLMSPEVNSEWGAGLTSNCRPEFKVHLLSLAGDFPPAWAQEQNY